MKLIEITPDLLTGVEEMDNQHKKIAEYINHVLDLASEGKVKDAITFYRETILPFVEYHLSSEEEFMMSIKYPGYEEHKRHHETVLKLFTKLGEELSNKKDLKETAYILSGWLYGHVGKTDKKYGKFHEELCLKNT